MFCLMDVSGSMTEHMKDLAKRFFMLLYIFLKRRYKHVEVVFIRHTHEAKEVDEETFFRSPETGGTVVSTALVGCSACSRSAIARRTGTSTRPRRRDGDNTATDNDKTRGAAGERHPARSASTSPISKSGARATRTDRLHPRETDLWRTYDRAAGATGWRSPCARSATAGTSSRCFASCSPQGRE